MKKCCGARWPARPADRPLKRLALRRNANKVRALERRIVRSMDLLTAITDEDLQSLGAGLDHNRSLTLTPGYNGWIAGVRQIIAATPRRVIIMGSFHWIVKQENLARFVKTADPIFKKHGNRAGHCRRYSAGFACNAAGPLVARHISTVS